MGTNDSDSKKFRKPVTELFETKSFERSRQEKAETVEDVRMESSMDKQGRLSFHYSVTWTEGDDGRSEEESLAKKRKKSELKIQDGLKRGKIECEGPCGKTVRMSEVVQFGCDHVICDKCRRSEKSAILFDGSPGCCNKECLEKARIDGYQLRSGRKLSNISATSLCSNEGPWEMLRVHVSIVRKSVDRVYRVLLDCEFPSQTRVAELSGTLTSYKQTIAKGRSFYSIRKPQSCRDLRRISLMDTNLRFYHLPEYVPFASGKLYVLIMGEGVQLY
ncbi:unnamed protein product [Caenorhabditis sp. 36 PRJEB53466]|nr:unnamed protein product [Caenorhabditis sp. 36 PRJEB53466]